MKLKAPKTSKEWALLWCKINNGSIKFRDHNAACGAMDLIEKFCTKLERSKAWNETTQAGE